MGNLNYNHKTWNDELELRAEVTYGVPEKTFKRTGREEGWTGR